MKYNTSNIESIGKEYYPMNIITEARSSFRHVVPITGDIGEIYEYGEFVKILACASEGDEVYIQLSSSGGDFNTCDYLCRRMDECEAKITVEIGLTCASVASAIALHAHAWVICPSSTMMIQSCSHSTGYGKESDVRAITHFVERVNKEWIERTYLGFLSEHELNDVLNNGKDLYFYSDDLHERMPRHKKYRQECSDREVEEIIKYWKTQDTA